jgi:hypothetical protein
MGGLIAGWMDARGYFNRLPPIAGSRALTLGLAGYAATRFIKGTSGIQGIIRMAGVAAVAAAAFDYGKVHGMGGTVPPVISAKPAPKGKGVHGADDPDRVVGDEAMGAHDDSSHFPGDGGPY